MQKQYLRSSCELTEKVELKIMALMVIMCCALCIRKKPPSDGDDEFVEKKEKTNVIADFFRCGFNKRD